MKYALIKSSKHSGSKKDRAHYAKCNGGSSVKSYCYWYWFPRVFFKNGGPEFFWLNRGLIIT